MDPWVGNSLIAFARLNVVDGLRKLYQQPWEAAHFGKPNLAAISPHADVLRAGYLAGGNALVLTIQAPGVPHATGLALDNIVQRSGGWRIERDGVLIAAGVQHDIRDQSDARASWSDQALKIDLDVNEPTDIIVWVNQ